MDSCAPGGTVAITAASGVTGAGDGPRRDLLFAEVTENFRAYAVGNDHRHLAEMRAVCARFGADIDLVFTPHLLPVARGILATVTVPSRAVAIRWSSGSTHYGTSDSSRSCRPPSLRDVVYRNAARISVARAAGVRRPTLVITAAIDNLLKGAAGQALQNANVLLGLEEVVGLAGMTSRVSTVIKVGGRAQQDPRLAAALAVWWAHWPQLGSLRWRVVRYLLRRAWRRRRSDGIAARGGYRADVRRGSTVTRPDDIDRLRMALSGLANKRLVAALTRSGCRALGISGEDGPLLTAELLRWRLTRCGRDGEERRYKLLAACSRAPVISPSWPRSPPPPTGASRVVSGEPGDTTLAR